MPALDPNDPENAMKTLSLMAHGARLEFPAKTHTRASIALELQNLPIKKNYLVLFGNETEGQETFVIYFELNVDSQKAEQVFGGTLRDKLDPAPIGPTPQWLLDLSASNLLANARQAGVLDGPDLGKMTRDERRVHLFGKKEE